MGQKRFYNRLSGLNPLSYIGVEPLSPPDLVIDTRAPTSTDSANFNEGALWLVDVSPFQVWMLASLDGNVATWIQLFPGSGTSGANTFPTDSGTAVQVGGVLNVFGANNITRTTGAGNTVTVSLVNGTNGQVIIGGGAQPMWANITSLGGTIAITNGPNTINLEAATVGTVVNLLGNSGPNVPPNGSGTINVVGANGITTSGNAVTHTLTITTASGHPILESLTGNSGGAVFPDGSNNINVVANKGLTVTGNPGTNTLTVTTADGNNILQSITGNSGGAVFPDSSDNINIVGGTDISVTGNPGTHTLTLAFTGTIPTFASAAWTPILQFGGATTGITYSTQAGQYTKIGNTVWFEAAIVLTSKGTAVGDATVAGLPFPADGVATDSFMFGDFVPGNISYGVGTNTQTWNIVRQGTTHMELVAGASGVGVFNFSNPNFVNNSFFSVNGWYYTNS